MTLAVFQTTVQNANGDAIPSAQVTVRLGSSSGALASLFSNSAGTTPITNPFNATTNGFARFFAAPGVYWISITGGGSTQVLERVVLAGDAATRDVTASATDTTAGRLLKVGDGGLLETISIDNTTNLNDLDLNADYSVGITDVTLSNNYPLEDTSTTFKIFTITVRVRNDGAVSQQLTVLRSVGPYVAGDIYIRTSALGVFTKWSRLYHTGNMQHLQNTSGATVNSNATVAGSGLTPAQTGTWRNVAGVNILNNGFGLFMRVV